MRSRSKSGAGFQKIDRVRHAILNRKFDGIHFVAQRLIDVCASLTTRSPSSEEKIFVIHDVGAGLWGRSAPANIRLAEM